MSSSLPINVLLTGPALVVAPTAVMMELAEVHAPTFFDLLAGSKLPLPEAAIQLSEELEAAEPPDRTIEDAARDGWLELLAAVNSAMSRDTNKTAAAPELPVQGTNAPVLSAQGPTGNVSGVQLKFAQATVPVLTATVPAPVSADPAQRPVSLPLVPVPLPLVSESLPQVPVSRLAVLMPQAHVVPAVTDQMPQALESRANIPKTQVPSDTPAAAPAAMGVAPAALSAPAAMSVAPNPASLAIPPPGEGVPVGNRAAGRTKPVGDTPSPTRATTALGQGLPPGNLVTPSSNDKSRSATGERPVEAGQGDDTTVELGSGIAISLNGGDRTSYALVRHAAVTLFQPVGTPPWSDELASRVALLVRSAKQSATLTLSPEDLGPVEVRISVRESDASVTFVAANADARAALEQAMPRLRDMLAAQGLSLADSAVFGDSQRSFKHPQSHGQSDGGLPKPTIDAGLGERQKSASPGEALLDLYA